MILEFSIKNRSVVRTLRKKSDIRRGGIAVQRGEYEYAWPDGTVTKVKVRQVNSSRARQVRSSGMHFYGYDWMADTILSHGAPLRTKDIQNA